MIRRALFLFLLVCLISCHSKKEVPVAKGDVLAQNIDSTADLSADFFMYANGGWIKKNPIPGDQGSWSIGHLVMEENLNRLREISEKAATTKATKGSVEQKIGDFWLTAMDTAKIESQGLAPLQPYLSKIAAISDARSLLATVAELKKIGSSTLFSNYVTQDDKNSDVMTYKLWQGGIGLPEREYYFKEDSATRNIREKYRSYIARMLVMSGDDSIKAAKDASAVLAL